VKEPKSTARIRLFLLWRENWHRGGKSKFKLLHYSSRDNDMLGKQITVGQLIK
jgi:hypothetical protein